MRSGVRPQSPQDEPLGKECTAFSTASLLTICLTKPSGTRLATMAHQDSGDSVQIAMLALILLALDGAAFPDC
jgi:hypothetical protein